VLDVLPQRVAQFVAVLAAQVDFIIGAVEGVGAHVIFQL
jgi:hypothetical protein